MFWRKNAKIGPKEETKLETINRAYLKPAYGNYKGNKYAERLITEWLLHDKICLAVDHDDTIFPWGFKGFEANIQLKRTMDVVKLAQSVGCYTTIWSACDPERYDEIKSYCSANGIVVDSINENPIPLPYGNNRKMYYNHLLDDRAGLELAIDMLEYVCYRVMTERKQSQTIFEV